MSPHHAESWAPPIDVYETQQAYVVTAEVPGLTREQVEIVVGFAAHHSGASREARLADSGSVHYHHVWGTAKAVLLVLAG